MPSAGVKPRPHRHSHEVIAPLARLALMPLAQPPLLKEALITQVQPSGRHFLFLERTLGIGLSPIGEQRPLQFSRQHIPAHTQLERGPTGALPASTALPHLRQCIGQVDATAIFHNHSTETLEQRHRGRLCCQTYLGESLQESLQKLRCCLRKTLVQTTGRDLNLSSPGHLGQAI